MARNRTHSNCNGKLYKEQGFKLVQFGIGHWFHFGDNLFKIVENSGFRDNGIISFRLVPENYFDRVTQRDSHAHIDVDKWVIFNAQVYNIVPHPPRSWEGGVFACTVQLARQKKVLDLSYEAMGDFKPLDEKDGGISSPLLSR